MQLYLVRHGETEYNRHDLFRGQIDIPLNETGRRQADATGEHLQSSGIAAFYSGPLERAMDTVRRIAAPHGAQPSVLPLLNDIDYGAWSGKTVNEIREAYPDCYELWVHHPAEVRFPDGESLREAYARIGECMEWLWERHADEAVVVVGHKVVNRLVLCIALGLPLEGIWRIEQANGAINLIQRNERGYMVLTMNDTCHLTGCVSGQGLT